MVWLALENPANTRGEDRFHIVVVSFWHLRVPGKRGLAVATREIDFAQREGRFRPFWFETCRFPQLAQTSVVFIGQKPANVMFKGVEAQRTLAFRELRKALGVVVIVSGKHPPDQTRMQVHERIQRARFPLCREQSRRTHFRIRGSMVSEFPRAANRPKTNKSASR